MKKLFIILLLFSEANAQIYTVPDRGQAGVIRLKQDRGLPNSITTVTADSEQASNYSFDATGTGSTYAANSLDPANFDNDAGHSDLASGVRYILTNTDPGYTLKGKTETRDQEITTNVARGNTYLRLTGGKAIAFVINSNRLTIGIATGIDAADAGFINNTFYDNTSTSTLITGFNTPAASDRITFGVYGYDVYIKWNDVEKLRFRCIYHCVKGKVALKAHGSGSGISVATVNHFVRRTLYSNTDTKFIDPRDFGMKSAATTGSITAASNQLTLADASQWVAGDAGIIKIGGEASFNGRAAGMRGTKGVGATFPSLSYANAAAMNADNSKPANTKCWLEDTGKSYAYISGTWTLTSPPNMVGDYANEDLYYDGMAIPKALRFKVVSKAGNVLTIDRNANVSTTSANVYFDNTFVLSKILGEAENNFFVGDFPVTDIAEVYDLSAVEETGITVNMPAGSYAVGEQINFTRSDVTLQGAGMGTTILFSPEGVASFHLNIAGVSNVIIQDFTVIGNARENGFGSHFEISYVGSYASAQLTQTDNITYPGGILFSGSSNITCLNIKCIDIFASACATTSFCSNVYRYNVQVEQTERIMRYLGWYLQDATTDNGVFENCSFTSPYINKAFEAFDCVGTQFINCTSVNGLWSFNNAGDFLVQDCSQTFTGMNKPPSIHINEPIINVNSNMGSDNAFGGNINNHVIIFDDYVDDNNDLMKGIAFGPSNTGLTITGGSYTSPDYFSGAAHGPQGIFAEGTDITVNGFTVVGSQVENRSFIKSNISIFDGAVLNCVAEYFHVYTAVTYTSNTGTKVIVDP